MTSSLPSQGQAENSGLNNNSQKEINLGEILSTLKRQWRVVAAGACVGLVGAALSVLPKKPVYQGEFQILLEDKNNSSAIASAFAKNPTLSLLSSGAGGSSQTKTQIEILNSPSVLLPVFKAVQASKPVEVAEGMRFESWSKSAITVNNKPETSVLNVEFRDTDKSIILPITQLLSNEYQKYSNRGRLQELNNLSSYLEKEINKFQPIAKASNLKALEFGYVNGLGIRDGLPIAGAIIGDSNSTSSGIGMGGGGSFEAMRTRAKQNVINLNLQIREAKRAGYTAIYFASQVANLTDQSSTFDKLTKIETELAEKRSRFKPNDPIIKRLERVRRTLIEYINKQTIALLKGQLALANAKLIALEKPKAVISKHRELTQQALRDEATLVGLQNQFQKLKLEQARDGDPWELISTPRVLDYPVSPHKKRTLAFGLLAGLFLGSGSALAFERQRGKVFTEGDLEDYLPGHRLQTLHTTEHEQLAKSVELLADGPLQKFASIAIVPVGNIRQSALNKFCSALKQSLKSKHLLISKDLNMTRKCDVQILVASPGSITRNELKNLHDQLSLQNAPIAGWILLDPKDSL